MPEFNTTPTVDTSTTKTETDGKGTSVRRLLTADEGNLIVQEAATWIETPYALVGANSIKKQQGDCSGTTSKIYFFAGFPYINNDRINVPTYEFPKLATGSPPRFEKVDVPQAGDILWWEGHVAIYVEPDVMWTAFNSRTKAPYALHSISKFRNDKPIYYRYIIYKGEEKW